LLNNHVSKMEGNSQMHVCRKCGRQHTEEEYKESRFCGNCGTILLDEKTKFQRPWLSKRGPTHAEMIADVISEMPEPFTTEQIANAIIEKYSNIRWIDKSSLKTDIAGCCVNLRSHDSLKDLPLLLVAVGRGIYRRYNPSKDVDINPPEPGEYEPKKDVPSGHRNQTIFEDIEKAKKVGETLHTLFVHRTGFFSEYTMPEYILPKNLREGSLEHALYLTYIISVDYQTDAAKLWRNARDTYLKSPEYFNPKNLSDMTLEDLSVILKDLGARYPKNGANAWKHISNILLDKYEGDPRKLTPEPLAVTEVKQLLSAFPNLRGRKLSNFYLRAMGEKGLLKIKNLKELDIPVDVQVGRFTIYTGCLQLIEGTLAGFIQEPPIQPAIEEIWREVAKALDIAPWQLDEPIWTIGSKLCSPKNCNACPVQQLCAKNFDARIQGNSVYWKK